jgi:uncharacterized protein (TIGR03000 family)
MVRQIFARSNLMALALLGILLVAEPASAQLFRRQSSADYNGYWNGAQGYYYSTPSYYTGSNPEYQPFFSPQIGQQYGYYRMSSAVAGWTGNSTALINVSVPADAMIWFESAQTTQTGNFRQFISPPLTPGQEFTYNIQVKWNGAGSEVTRSRRITVHAGDIINLSFNSSSNTGNSVP